MDILSKLEDFDSRIDSARGNLSKWFVTIAVVVVGGVVASWAWRNWSTSRHQRAWRTFDTHLQAYGGGGYMPGVFVREDPSVAATAVNDATGGPWGDLAATLHRARMMELKAAESELERAMAVQSNARELDRILQLASDSTSESHANGAGRLKDRLSGLASWVDGNPKLARNVVPESAPGFLLRVSGIDLKFKVDPMLDSAAIDQLKQAATGGTLVGLEFSEKGGPDRRELVAPSSDADTQKSEGYKKLVESLGKSRSSLSLFAGSIATTPGGTFPGTICIVTADSLGYEQRGYRALGVITEGLDRLPPAPSATTSAPAMRIESFESLN